MVNMRVQLQRLKVECRVNENRSQIYRLANVGRKVYMRKVP